MKKTSIILTVALLLISLQAFAIYPQDNQQSQQGGSQMGHRGGPNPDQELARLTSQLNLTSDQQSKIKPMLESQAQQMQQLRQDTSLSQQDRFSKMREIRQNTRGQIREVLTPDQQQKFDAMEQQHEGHHRGGQGGQTPPQ